MFLSTVLYFSFPPEEDEFLLLEESEDCSRSVRGKQTAGTVSAAASCSVTTDRVAFLHLVSVPADPGCK